MLNVLWITISVLFTYDKNLFSHGIINLGVLSFFFISILIYLEYVFDLWLGFLLRIWMYGVGSSKFMDCENLVLESKPQSLFLRLLNFKHESVGGVKRAQLFLIFLVNLFYLVFLSMRSNLSSGSCLDCLLYLYPVASIRLQCYTHD